MAFLSPLSASKSECGLGDPHTLPSLAKGCFGSSCKQDEQRGLQQPSFSCAERGAGTGYWGVKAAPRTWCTEMVKHPKECTGQ